MSGLTCIQTLDTLIIFLKEFFENVDFEKIQQMTTKKRKISQHSKSLRGNEYDMVLGYKSFEGLGPSFSKMSSSRQTFISIPHPFVVVAMFLHRF